MKRAALLSDNFWITTLSLTVIFYFARCGDRQSNLNQASVLIGTDIPPKTYNPMIFWGFLEHSDNQIYGGVFDPGSSLADEQRPLFVHPLGIVKRKHFHALAMYANQLEKRIAKSSVVTGNFTGGEDTVSIIDAIATVDENGKYWAISLVNRHPSDLVYCIVKIGDEPLIGKYKATILSGDSPEALNNIEFPNCVIPIETGMNFRKENPACHLIRSQLCMLL